MASPSLSMIRVDEACIRISRSATQGVMLAQLSFFDYRSIGPARSQATHVQAGAKSSAWCTLSEAPTASEESNSLILPPYCRPVKPTISRQHRRSSIQPLL